MGCRCNQGCAQEGEKIKVRQRERRKRKLSEKVDPSTFTHGINGYRTYGCRCEVCAEAGALFNMESREIMREKRARKREEKAAEAREKLPLIQAPEVDPVVPDALPSVDWSEVAHLMPGANVRRRSA